MPFTDAELEQQLKDVGKLLPYPPNSVQLLAVLDELENILSNVNQGPKESMLEAMKTPGHALIHSSLLKHSDIDIRVAVACCISQITRITAPDLPYTCYQMKGVFQLIVSTLEDLADRSSRSYNKRTSILETISRVRSSVIMLDLECEDLIVKMFEHFFKSVRDYHLGGIFSLMENVMVAVIEESYEISVELLKPLLASVKKDCEGVLPVARKLGKGVFLKSANKLKCYIVPALTSLGESLDMYHKVVAAVCEGTTANFDDNDDNDSEIQLAGGSKLEKGSSKSVPRDGVTVTVKEKTSVGQASKKPDEKSGDDKASDLKRSKSKSTKQAGEKSKQSGKKLETPVEKGEKIKTALEDFTESDNEPLRLSARKSTSKKKDDGKKRADGKNVAEEDRAKSLLGDDEMDVSPKIAAKEDENGRTSKKKDDGKKRGNSKNVAGKAKTVTVTGEGSLTESPATSAKRKRSTGGDEVSDAIKYDESLVGKKVKIWRSEDKMNYEGVVTEFYPANKKHKVSYTADVDEEILNLRTQKWEFLEEFSVQDYTEQNTKEIAKDNGAKKTSGNSCDAAATASKEAAKSKKDEVTLKASEKTVNESHKSPPSWSKSDTNGEKMEYEKEKLRLEGERLRLEAEKLSIEAEKERSKIRQEDERLRLEDERLKLEAEKMKLSKKESDERIMMMDVSVMPEMQRLYFEKLQKEILRRCDQS